LFASDELYCLLAGERRKAGQSQPAA